MDAAAAAAEASASLEITFSHSAAVRGGPSPSVRVSLLVMSSVRGDKNGSGSLVGTNLLDASDLRHWETFSAEISCGMIWVHPSRHF